MTGGKIRLTYSDETTEEMNIISEMVTGFDNTELGSQTLTVTYGGKSTTFEVTIIEERIARLDKTEMTLEKGETGTITATIEPENATNVIIRGK